MILTVRFDRLKNGLLSFTIPLWQEKNVILDSDKDYKLEITEIKSKRSLRQNALMWTVIHKIATKIGMTDDEVYCNIIEMANLKAVYLQTVPMAKVDLLKVFRVVQEAETHIRTSENGIETQVYKCYYGTSKYDTSEMNEIIEQTLAYAHKCEVDVREFENTI